MVSHKVRLLLTTASIALGVAFLAGTLILTDTMSLAFTQLFGKIGAGTDAVVRTEASYDQSEGVGLSRAPIADSVLKQVKAVDGVRTAEGSVTGYALLTDGEGKAVLTKGGAPTQGYSMADDVTLARRRRRDHRPCPPRAAPGRHRRHLGREAPHRARVDINILFRGPTQKFTVVGTVEFGGEKNLGGTTSAYFDTATAQKVLGSPDSFDAINVRAADGVTDASSPSGSTPSCRTAPRRSPGARRQGELRRGAKDLQMVSVMFMIFAGSRCSSGPSSSGTRSR
jgi:putative ABC transport system permease protein